MLSTIDSTPSKNGTLQYGYLLDRIPPKNGKQWYMLYTVDREQLQRNTPSVEHIDMLSTIDSRGSLLSFIQKKTDGYF